MVDKKLTVVHLIKYFHFYALAEVLKMLYLGSCYKCLLCAVPESDVR